MLIPNDSRLKQTYLQGFTLIEISIVIIVIGLIIGGILVGRDLIRAAEIRSVIKQIEQYEIAVNTFKGKYNCLAGDCSSASSFNLWNTNGNGDGDGIIEGTENRYFWVHLSRAGFIDWTFTYNPDLSGVFITYACSGETPCLKAAISPLSRAGFAIFHMLDVNNIDYRLNNLSAINHNLWIVGQTGGGSENAAVLWPADAWAIDSKIDDSLPYTGRVVAAGDANGDPYGPYEPYPAAGGPQSGACLSSSTTPYSYNIQNRRAVPPPSSSIYNNEGLCSLVIKMSF